MRFRKVEKQTKCISIQSDFGGSTVISVCSTSEQQWATTSTFHVVYNLYCDGLVRRAAPSASAGLVGALTHLHFLYAVLFFLVTSIPCRARWGKSSVRPGISLKPSPKLQRSRMRMATDPVVITDLQMDHTLFFPAHRLVWNYDDAQGAGILFSVLLIRKQEQTTTKRKEREREMCVI